MSLLNLPHKTQNKSYFSFTSPYLLFQFTVSAILNSSFKRHRYAPYSFRASFSVEASVILPIFVTMAVSVMIFFRILAVGWGIDIAMQEVSRKNATYTPDMFFSQNDTSNAADDVIILGMLEYEFLKTKIPTKFIRGGLVGIDLSESKVDERDIELVAKYHVDLPVRWFFKNGFDVVQKTKVRRWSGYDPFEDSVDSDNVYVTEYGSAYHNRIDCVYLAPSISVISSGELAGSRNKSGGKYHLCEKCGTSKNTGLIYITDYGDSYHTSISCSSLVRYIKKIDRQEAISSGYHGCSKCG